ncbi:MAG: phosphotransferase [Devosia sp.]|uniref:CehA/McbA family metallohydrolase n=1 Tax=Devosia sp. TaxID=1871048 RepID=UPI0026274143|nr:CehA/McbA family metallohydrolase [Devosia sp.]MDB5537179.1 phosphotransferase [Devosia sp.]MDB5588869.1 phosphotransferase [Devosia sp.]
MSADAFSAPGRFFKGNLHTHSTRSDGGIGPEEVCKRYRERGYDFISLTDHFVAAYEYPVVDTLAYRTNAFTTISGAECHAPGIENGDVWHILAVGLPLDFEPNRPDETGPKLAQRCIDAGAFVTMPHPEWYGLTLADAQSIPNAHAVEVYNHTSHVRQGRGGGAYLLDALLNEGRRINAVAADDAHWFLASDENRDAFGGWVMVKAERNEPEELVAALKKGNYYSSQGPTIDNIEIIGDTIHIECSQAEEIMVVGPASKNAYLAGTGLTSAQLPITKFASQRCRVMVRSADGKLAWSNPIYL